jgi:hypothetical protein
VGWGGVKVGKDEQGMSSFSAAGLSCVFVCVCVQVVGDGYSTYYYMNGRPTDDLPGIAEFLKTFHSWKLVGECLGPSGGCPCRRLSVTCLLLWRKGDASCC